MTNPTNIDEILIRLLLNYSQRIKHINPKNLKAISEAKSQLRTLMEEALGEVIGPHRPGKKDVNQHIDIQRQHAKEVVERK
jgi:hypothetical protein